MGCAASASQGVHPSIYNETILKQKKANGEIKPRPVKVENPNHLKGDYSQFQVAKHMREKQQKERAIKLFMAADEMSGKMLEEREMLTLGTRSRGTSRNTSRATSPTPVHRRSVQFKEEVQQPPMTPVVEVASRGSFRSRDNEDDIGEPIEPVKEKHKRKQKKVKNKPKTKKKKTKKTKKSKKGQNTNQAVESDDETEDDSGLEEDGEEESKENEIIDIVATTNNVVDHSRDRGKKKTILKRNTKSVESGDVTQDADIPRHRDKHGSDQRHARVKTIHSSSKDSGIHDFDSAFGHPNNSDAVEQSGERPGSRI